MGERRTIKTFTPSWFALKRPCCSRYIRRDIPSYHWSRRSKDRRRWISKCERRHKIKQDLSVWSLYAIDILFASRIYRRATQIRRNSIAKKYDHGILTTHATVLQDGKPRVFRTCEIGRIFYRRRHAIYGTINNVPLDFFFFYCTYAQNSVRSVYKNEIHSRRAMNIIARGPSCGSWSNPGTFQAYILKIQLSRIRAGKGNRMNALARRKILFLVPR